MINRLVLAAIAAFAPFSLVASSIVVNRFIPSFVACAGQAVDLPTMRPTIKATMSIGHASRASALINDPRQLYKFDGIMEMSGWYDLRELIASTQDANPSFVSPMAQETGGVALTNLQLLFGARSSVSLYGTALQLTLPFNKHVRAGIEMPIWHVETRQEYGFPVVSNDDSMLPAQREQVQRFRQQTHAYLGLAQKDWIVTGLGDVSCWVEGLHTWDYLWLIRTFQLSGTLFTTLSSAKKRDLSSPASFSLGAQSVGIGLTLAPRAEIKEGIWINLPVSVVAQTPYQTTERIPAYAEPLPFGALTGTLRTVPGVTVAIEPSLVLMHFIDNLHLTFGLSWTKHYADRFEDKRPAGSSPSYLTRTALPANSFGASTQPAQGQWHSVQMNKYAKQASTNWHRTYLHLGLQYELTDLFPRLKYAPALDVALHYCVGDARAARMHQISAGFSWRF